MWNSTKSAADYDHRTVLVTGGLGFIGSNLVRHLATRSSATIRVVDSLNPMCGGDIRNIDGLRRPVDVHIFDLRDTTKLEGVLRGVDVVFNLAGQVSHSDSMKDPFQDLRSNVEAQLALLESCRQHCPDARVVYAGTRQCYGRPRQLPVGEDHPIAPRDVNGAHKFAAECYHSIYHRAYGLATCSLRLTNTYGPRQMIRNPRQGFIGWFVHQAVCDRTITVFGDGSQLRDLNYVSCVVDALLRAGVHPRAPGRVYNLGDAEPISLLALAELPVAGAGKGRTRLAPFPPQQQVIDIGNYYSNFTRIQRELGWRPLVSLRDGLSSTIRFFEKHRAIYLESESQCTSLSLTSGGSPDAFAPSWSRLPAG
jgi:UDP-glucose 4-epimerase